MAPETSSPSELQRVRRIAHLWDDAFTIPVLGWRVGLDAVVGLLPGIGDLAGLVAGLYPLVVAVRFGAPAALLARMGLNLIIDTALGSVPVVGDLFDIAWKANRRNRVLLERWATAPRRVDRASRALLAGMAVGGLLLLALAGWLVVRLVAALVP